MLSNDTQPQHAHSQPRCDKGSQKAGFSNMKTRVYKPGEIIIQEGETSRNLFVLTDGVVEVSKKIEDKTIILSEIDPPQVFGELAFFAGSPRSATVRAKTRVEVIILGYEILKYQIAELPTWIKRTLDTLVSRVRSCNQRIIELEGEIFKLKGK